MLHVNPEYGNCQRQREVCFRAGSIFDSFPNQVNEQKYEYNRPILFLYSPTDKKSSFFHFIFASVNTLF